MPEKNSKEELRRTAHGLREVEGRNEKAAIIFWVTPIDLPLLIKPIYHSAVRRT